MVTYKKCSNCGEIKEESVFRKMTIYEKVKMRFRGDKGYVGHTKLELCFDCLNKIGYKPYKD